MEDENGVTGLNPSKARADINNINSGFVQVQRDLQSAFSSYFSKLSTMWFSSLAVNFRSEIKGIVNELDTLIIDSCNKMVSSCCGAYNSIAPKHGESTISIGAGPFVSDDYAEMKEAGPNSEIGMQIKDVTIETELLLGKLKDLSSGLDRIPTSISFYDTTGSLANSCRTRIDEIRNSISSTIDKTIRLISNYIVQETMRVEQGASDASESLRGSGSSGSF